MVGRRPTCHQLVFAARPEYLSLTHHCMSGCPKYKGTTCRQIPTTQYIYYMERFTILRVIVAPGAMLIFRYK